MVGLSILSLFLASRNNMLVKKVVKLELENTKDFAKQQELKKEIYQLNQAYVVARLEIEQLKLTKPKYRNDEKIDSVLVRLNDRLNAIDGGKRGKK
jgi:hypothetical protein